MKWIIILLSCSIALGNVAPQFNGYDPNTFPFPVDPNKIIGKSLGYKGTKKGGRIASEIRYSDPDGDPMSLVVFGLKEAGATLADNWVYWTATDEEVVHYITIMVTDHPIDPNQPPRTTKGTVCLYAFNMRKFTMRNVEFVTKNWLKPSGDCNQDGKSDLIDYALICGLWR